MKYALIIPDGCADEPQQALGGLTPLQAAELPHMDEAARRGAVGLTDHVPASMPSGSDVGTMSLFGYDPLVDHTGRAPLEAAAMGVSLGPDDWAVRCNLVTVEEGRMKSFTAGQVPSDVGRALIESMQQACCGDVHWKFHPGVSYRNLLVYRSRDGNAPFASDTYTVPPHDITGRPIDEHLPMGSGSCDLRELMQKSRDVFAASSANRRRTEQGELPVTQVWLWGQGRAPSLQPFQDRFGVRGAVITAVDLLRGIGRLVGFEIVEVPGATGYTDTDYAAKGRAAVETLDSTDFVVVHVEATDEASHEGDAAAKVRALERIDADIVAPVLDYLESRPESRLLICPDHPTFLRTKTHSHGMVPFAICGTGIAPDEAAAYDEPTAAATGDVIPSGHLLIARFIGEH